MPLVFYLKKLSLYPSSSRFSPMLSTRSLIALHFTFRSITYFVLIFVNGIRSVSRLILLTCRRPVFLMPFVEKKWEIFFSLISGTK